MCILETYREYKKVKSRLSVKGSQEKKVKHIHFEDNIHVESQRSPPSLIQPKKDGVFDISLNKEPKKKKKINGDFYVGGKREGEGERKSVWKLRRWSKSRGHRTVVVKKEEEEDGREGQQKRGENGVDVAASGSNSDEMSNEVHCTYTRMYMCTLCSIHVLVQCI